MSHQEVIENSKTEQNSPIADFIYKYSGAELVQQLYNDIFGENGKAAEKGKSGGEKLSVPPASDKQTGNPITDKETTNEKAPEKLPLKPEDAY